jgi:hypothetical protein
MEARIAGDSICSRDCSVMRHASRIMTIQRYLSPAARACVGATLRTQSSRTQGFADSPWATRCCPLRGLHQLRWWDSRARILRNLLHNSVSCSIFPVLSPIFSGRTPTRSSSARYRLVIGVPDGYTMCRPGLRLPSPRPASSTGRSS